MTRAITAAADPGALALAELKAWLAISTPHEDEALAALVATALAMCEAFTGQVPLLCGLRETIAPAAGWTALSPRPVRAITGVAALTANGDDIILAPDAYEIDIDADGTGRIRLRRSIPQRRIAVDLTAGLAAEWSGLPDTLRHGVIRLAAALYRQRDNGDLTAPPSAVAALWRPFRRMRLT